MSMPFFSIVIPTRNRCRLLATALQSALEQTFDDYEVIVSNNYSNDDTEQVVRELSNSKVRYVKTDRVMPMPDHWEFVLDHARGQFVTYLCDDDALAPTALARANKLLMESQSRLVVLCSGIYYAPDWFDHTLRNVAVFPPHTGEVREHRSNESIRHLYNSCRVVYEAPRMINSFCHRETMLRVRGAAGRIFLLSPDYSFAALALTAVPAWLYVDEPLHLQGVFPEGIGSTNVFNGGEPAREYAREFREDKLFRRVPLKVPLVANYITETLLMCKEYTPKLSTYDIDLVQYFLSCWNDIVTRESNGVDVSADKKEFFRVLAEQPSGVRDRVGVVANCPPGRDPVEEWADKHRVRASIRSVINKSALLTNLEAFVRGSDEKHGLAGPYVHVSGEASGFTNILECARQLPALAHAATVPIGHAGAVREATSTSQLT